MSSPHSELMTYLEALRARLNREQRAASGRELDALRGRWVAADERHQAWRRGDVQMPRGVVGVVPRPPSWELLEIELAPAEPDDARRKAGNRVRQPAATPHALVEQALGLKAAGLGRRKIAQAVPELADWEAQRIVYYHGKGEPEGLWLDAEDRMRWGPAISSTPAGLILPNPWKPPS